MNVIEAMVVTESVQDALFAMRVTSLISVLLSIGLLYLLMQKDENEEE